MGAAGGTATFFARHARSLVSVTMLAAGCAAFAHAVAAESPARLAVAIFWFAAWAGLQELAG